MSLLNFKDNAHITEKLFNAVKNSNISHAYLFEGENRIDKLQLAENFVKAILCEEKNGDACEHCRSCNKINHGNHEDLIYVRPEGNSIKDQTVEEMQNRLQLKPYSGNRNVVIIEGADLMTLRAQNRLLKTLEEPSPGTVIILLSENKENLAKTILSRCMIYKLSQHQAVDSREALGVAAGLADMLLDNGNFHDLSKVITEFAESKQKAIELLNVMESWYRDLLLYEYDEKGNLIVNTDHIDEIEKKSRLYKKARLCNAIQFIEEAKNDINRNLNINYTLKNMMIRMVMQ